MKYEPKDQNSFSIACNRFYDSMSNYRQDTVVHYCTIQTLDAILREGFLRAVDSKFMNDLGEYQFGTSILKSKTNEDIKCSAVPMTVSFSCEADLTTQWAMYAKELGVGIELDFSFSDYWGYDCKKKTIYGYPPVIMAETDIKDRYLSTGISYPLNVIYCNNSNNREIDTLINSIDEALTKYSSDYIPPKKTDFLQLASTFIKNDGFDYEKEARISTFMFDESMGTKPKIRFQANEYYLRPYVNLCFIRESPKKREGRAKNIGWPIKTIWIGPGRNQPKAVESVIKRLEMGEIKTFPLPFEEFSKRLNEYIQNMYIFSGLESNAASKSANCIIKKLITDNEKYFEDNGKVYHKCIDFDDYITAKLIIEKAQNSAKKVIEKHYKNKYKKMYKKSYIKSNAEAQAKKVINEFERDNYFSHYGIRVKASNKTFSFV